MGGSSYDEAFSIQQTTDRGYIIAGYSKSNDGDVSGYHPGYDAYGQTTYDCWIVKLDSNGNLVETVSLSEGTLGFTTNYKLDNNYNILERKMKEKTIY